MPFHRGPVWPGAPIDLHPANAWTDDLWFLDQDTRSVQPNEGWWPPMRGDAGGRSSRVPVVIDAGDNPGNIGDVDFAGATSKRAWSHPSRVASDPGRSRHFCRRQCTMPKWDAEWFDSIGLQFDDAESTVHGDRGGILRLMKGPQPAKITATRELDREQLHGDAYSLTTMRGLDSRHLANA
jgi:hypothetical protein